MNFVISAARARTLMRDSLFDSLDQAKADAAALWDKVRPKLKLSRDMTSEKRRARFARNILRANLPTPARYLEIGSFEGSSLCFVHELLRGQMRATAIDPFMNYDELGTLDMEAVKAHFLFNTATVGADVRFLHGTAIEHLPSLVEARESFDLIYIDGSHSGLDVMTDAVLCWRLLAPGGLMIFDDYRWQGATDAIGTFVKVLGRNATVIDVASQLFLRRNG